MPPGELTLCVMAMREGRAALNAEVVRITQTSKEPATVAYTLPL